MDTRIAPIERPTSLLMKIAYAFTKWKFGKVLSPLKVVYARLPLSFSLFSNKIQELDQKLVLDPALALMIRIHVAQINSCHFCIDIAKSKAMQRFSNTERFYRLQEYKILPLYTDAEKAALTFTEELTQTKHVSDATYNHTSRYFSERELIEISWLVATEHYYNLINVTFNLHSDNLCDIRYRKKQAV